MIWSPATGQIPRLRSLELLTPVLGLAAVELVGPVRTAVSKKLNVADTVLPVIVARMPMSGVRTEIGSGKRWPSGWILMEQAAHSLTTLQAAQRTNCTGGNLRRSLARPLSKTRYAVRPSCGPDLEGGVFHSFLSPFRFFIHLISSSFQVLLFPAPLLTTQPSPSGLSTTPRKTLIAMRNSRPWDLWASTRRWLGCTD